MLEQLLGSTTRVKLLNVFFQSPDKSFFVRELARLIGMQLNAVRRELANLEKLGIVAVIESKDVERKGYDNAGTIRSKFYGLNQASLLLYELKSLLLKAEVLEQRELIDALASRAGELKLLILTGIFNGEKDVGTDILMVGSIKPVVVGKLIGDFEKKSGKTIRYTTMGDKEFRERKEIGDKFLYGIFESKHITVIDEYGIN